jgi:hypothetical protein
METLIDEQIAALGQTKVLVALKPEVLGSALTDRDLAAVTNEARGSIESYFVQPDQQQSAALAVAAAHFSGRKRVSPRSLEREKVRVFPRLGLAVGIRRCAWGRCIAPRPTGGEYSSGSRVEPDPPGGYQAGAGHGIAELGRCAIEGSNAVAAWD